MSLNNLNIFRRSLRHNLFFILAVISLCFLTTTKGIANDHINAELKNLKTSNNRVSLELETQFDPLQKSALSALNKIREMVGLETFSANSLLTKSAFNHALYSTSNNLAEGHIEDKTSYALGFTGEKPSDRMAYVGYSSLFVAENVSSGQSEYELSIDGLMAAIYHRFAFINPLYNEIGLAKSSYENGRDYYVYNLGNKAYNSLCNEPSYMGFDTYFYQVCTPDVRIEGAKFNQIKTEILNKVPELILWPAPNSTQISPVFYEEDPDPLPDYSISGYPISVEFNPQLAKKVRVLSFNLFNEDSGQEIKQTRLLDKRTDPNHKLTEHQFVLFPLKRLENNTKYRVFLLYKINHRVYKKNWVFTTRELAKGTKIYTLTSDKEKLLLPEGISHFILYFPPSKKYPKFNSYNVKYSLHIKPKINFIDNNTLDINLNSLVDSQLLLTLSDGREFNIQFVDK